MMKLHVNNNSDESDNIFKSNELTKIGFVSVLLILNYMLWTMTLHKMKTVLEG